MLFRKLLHNKRILWKDGIFVTTRTEAENKEGNIFSNPNIRVIFPQS
jgi:hypothetical protein